MQPLPPLSRTAFYASHERLLHGKDPARSLDGDGPRAWTRLDQYVHYVTYAPPGWSSSGSVLVGGYRFDSREIADWSTAPHWHEGHGVNWASAPPAEPELALGLCHADPRVREAALGHAAGRPGVLALVLIRCSDTAEPVRERARAVLAGALGAAGEAELRALIPLALLVSTRRYGGRGWELLQERPGSAPAALLVELAGHPDPGVRLGAVRAALGRGLLAADRVGALASGDPDGRVRLAALRSGVLSAERGAGLVLTARHPEVRREALELALAAGVLTPGRLLEIAAATRDRKVRRRCEEAARPSGPSGPLLDSLLTHGRASLRVLAVRALRGAGRAAELAAHLADPAAPVREAARRELRAEGGDPLAHYRALCADSPAPGAGSPVPGAVHGLAETGEAADLPLLWSLARHPEGRVRAAALAGLRRHGAATPEELLPYLADPHPPVVLAVRSLVVPYARTRPEPWLQALFAPGRAAAVRAAGRILLELRPLLVRRRIASSLTSHRDPAVRGWARELLRDRLDWGLEAGEKAARRLADGGGAPLDEAVDTADPAAWTALDLGVRALDPYEDTGAFASRADTALCHQNGRIREAAVVEAAGVPELLPLVVLRCADWVPQVREAARRVLGAALRDSGEECLRALTPMALHLGGRHEGRWAVELFEAALREPRYAEVRAELCAHRDRRTRRAAVRISLECADSPEAYALARRAAREPDAVLRRLWTGAALAALAAHGSEPSAVDALLASRAGDVRAAGVTALRAAGRAGEADRHLTDPSGLVRACARWLVRQAGGEARAHYLRLCREAPSPGALLGLAECAVRTDSAVLAGFLGHLDGPVRAAAVAGLRMLDAPVPGPEALRPLLDDPSPAVVREVVRSLRPVAGRLPADWLALRARPERPGHVRRAAVRLLAAQGADEGLPALTAMLDDPDPSLRHTALDLLRRWDWPRTARGGGIEPERLLTLFRKYRGELGWDEMRRTRLEV